MLFVLARVKKNETICRRRIIFCRKLQNEDKNRTFVLIDGLLTILSTNKNENIRQKVKLSTLSTICCV